MNNHTIQNKSYSVFEAIVIGIFFFLSLTWTRVSATVPLFNIYPNFVINFILPLLSTLLCLTILLERRYLNLILALGALNIMLIILYRYSVSYAFLHFTLLMILFIYLFNNENKNYRRIASQLILSLLFLFAALQKINPEYLSGKEFTSGGTFIRIYELWFPHLIPGELPQLLKHLPAFSIFIELVIAIGILLYPMIFTHLIGLFLLVLSFINPPVLFVYFLLLPLFIGIHHGFSDFLEENNILKKYLKSPFFWAFYITISIHSLDQFMTAIASNFIFSGLIVLMHFYIFYKYDITSRLQFEKFNWTQFNYWKIWLVPTVMILLFTCSYFVLPSPIGFKMFSTRRFQIPHYKLSIAGNMACRFSTTEWFFSPVTDSKFNWVDPDNCFILFPTKSGLEFIQEKICQKFPETAFQQSRSDETQINDLNCSSTL